MTRRLPDAEIPTLVLPSAKPTITDDAALWIGPITVYSTGLAFTVHAAFKTPRDTESLTLSSYTHPATVPALHLTAVYGDGRFATNTVDFRVEPADPATPSLIALASHTGTFDASADYQLSPAPSGCSLTLSLAVPVLSIAERRVTITASQFDEAAIRIVRLWDERGS